MIKSFIVMVTIWVPDLSSYEGPRYKALAKAITDAILKGELKQGVKLPPQRRLADELGVTIGTITRAYALIEQSGHVYAKVGSGTFVGDVKSPTPYVPKDKLTHNGRELIDFATCRAPLSDQVAVITESLQQLAAEPSVIANLIDYQTSYQPHHLSEFTGWLRSQGLQFAPQNMHLTYGGQHGIFVYLNATCRAGDVVVCDPLCYPGFTTAAKKLGLKLVTTETDEQGILPEKLVALCKQQQPKLIYLTPNNQNPTCALMGMERRRAVIDVCEEYDVAILEDDVNFCLPEEKLTSLQAMAPHRVAHVASLSKQFSGGLRVGFLITPAPLTLSIQQMLHANCWMISPFAFELAYQWISQGKVAQINENIVAELAKRHQAVSDWLEDEFAFSDVTVRMRGFNVWLTLPDSIQADVFSHQLAEMGIIVRAASNFVINSVSSTSINHTANAIRLSISAPNQIETVLKGLGIVKQCILRAKQEVIAVV